MSFSISGSGSSKAEAKKALIDSFYGCQPAAPADALVAGMSSIDRLGEPAAGKAISIGVYGHAFVGKWPDGSIDSNDDGFTMSGKFVDIPVVATTSEATPAPVTDSAQASAPAVELAPVLPAAS